MWVLDALAGLDLARVVVVVGHGSTRVTKALAEAGPAGVPVEVVEQPVQRGDRVDKVGPADVGRGWRLSRRPARRGAGPG